MIKAFIPKNLYARAFDGKLKKIYFVEVKRYIHRPDICLDMYYESHRAASKWTEEVRDFESEENE